LHGRYSDGDNAHPGSNTLSGFHWPEELADLKIEEIIERFRSRNVGFTWYLSPFDEPQDLTKRLEQHGLILSGDYLIMVQVGLEPKDFLSNPKVDIEVIDGSSDEAIETVLQIKAKGWNWTQAQVDQRRPGFFEHAKDWRLREHEVTYLASLNGKPVGQSVVIFHCGIAYMADASVLPEARNQGVYSAMLARRLQDAHLRGYQIAGIHAAPTNRRVIEKFGFKQYGRSFVYAWMPATDISVIRSLVPQN
jgi:GNAT superfamily N-acetyltransferase